MSTDTPSESITELLSYSQADEEGVIVKVSRQAIHEVVAENARLREELELIRAALTGDDYASLPSDLPTVRMAHTIRADHDKFRNQVRDTCHRAEQAEKELAEAKRDYTEKDRQYHMDAINRLASFLAMSGTSFEVVQAAIDNMTRLVAQKNLAIQSAKEWREQKQRADSYALDIEELQEQLRQLNAAYRTETQAKILSDACYENQYHRAEQAEARALAAEKDAGNFEAVAYLHEASGVVFTTLDSAVPGTNFSILYRKNDGTFYRHPEGIFLDAAIKGRQA